MGGESELVFNPNSWVYDDSQKSVVTSAEPNAHTRILFTRGQGDKGIFVLMQLAQWLPGSSERVPLSMMCFLYRVFKTLALPKRLKRLLTLL